ncbi:MAG: hypothetical protein GX653_04090 [Clostridiales bacterium]|nr:hypothetical protein [Clostridiales bacterium]
MQKRVLALLAALVMVLSLAPSSFAGELTAEQKIEQLVSTVQTFIDDREYTTFKFNGDKNQFTGAFTLDSVLGEADVYVYIYDDMVAVDATPALRVPEEYRDNIAIFLTLANFVESYAYFQFSYESGYIYSHNMQLVESAFPTTDEIHVLIHEPIHALDKYGNGISKVANGADPVETYNALRAEIEAQQGN